MGTACASCKFSITASRRCLPETPIPCRMRWQLGGNEQAKEAVEGKTERGCQMEGHHQMLHSHQVSPMLNLALWVMLGVSLLPPTFPPLSLPVAALATDLQTSDEPRLPIQTSHESESVFKKHTYQDERWEQRRRMHVSKNP